MPIHTHVIDAVEDANRQAQVLSLKHPGLIMAVVTKDRSGKILSWATTEQYLASNETEVGFWTNGVKL